MGDLTRRGFAAASLCGLAGVGMPRRVLAAAQCVVGSQETPLPNQLAVDCASRQNFQLFRRYSNYIGLAGVVSMISAKGRWGTYPAGSLILFPWLKPQDQTQRRLVFTAAFPTSAATSRPVRPIPGSTLPQDEYLCRFVLQAPWQDFIGFLVEAPFTVDQTRSGWCSNIPQLADGVAVGVDWTSSNLNRAWFGGSSYIPDSSECHGDAWRALITDALSRASTSKC